MSQTKTSGLYDFFNNVFQAIHISQINILICFLEGKKNHLFQKFKLFEKSKDFRVKAQGFCWFQALKIYFCCFLFIIKNALYNCLKSTGSVSTLSASQVREEQERIVENQALSSASEF
jgi:hypothetical protein